MTMNKPRELSAEDSLILDGMCKYMIAELGTLEIVKKYLNDKLDRVCHCSFVAVRPYYDFCRELMGNLDKFVK